jgi:hypothetical protein
MSEERYRLAWLSARRRARRYDDLVDELDERATNHHGMYEQAQALAVRMEEENEKLRREQTSILHTLGVTAKQRDDARAELVRLGKENEEHRRAIRSWQAAQEADEAETAAWLKRVNDGLIDALKEATPDADLEERLQRIKATAAERLRARLEEVRIGPDPVCPAHGEHPHTFGPLEEPRRCLDCPVCACLYVEYPEHAAGPCVLCGWRKP